MTRNAGDIRLTVLGRRALSDEITEFTLVPGSGVTPAPYAPGSHLPVRCGPVVNAYSLTDEGYRPDAYRIAVRRRGPDGGSAWLHREATIGSELIGSPPRSAFPPVLAASHHLLVAAGIGITPMLSHLKAAARWHRSAELISGSSIGREVFVAELDEFARNPRIGVTRSSGRTDLLRAVDDSLVRQPIGTHLYACGPQGFLDHIAERSAALGWPDERVHIEHFDAPELAAGTAFDVRIASTGDIVPVPAGQSLLTALDRRGIRVDRLCERGVCGRCEIGVIAGRIHHRDLVFTPAERERGDHMMACVSRALTAELELDL